MRKKLVVALTTLMMCVTMISCSSKSVVENDSPKAEEVKKSEELNIIKSNDGSFQVGVSKGWKVDEDAGPYDLRLVNESIGYNGFFVYSKEDISESGTAKDIFQNQVEDLKSKRENFKIIEDMSSYEANGKTITKVLYSGEKDGNKNNYYFNLIEFGSDSKIFIISLQTTIPSEFEKSRENIDKVIQSAELIK